MLGSRLTRRTMLATGGGIAAAAAVSPYLRLLDAAAAAGIRPPDSLPDPTRPAGEPTAALPFDHVVVVMMENHSFDAYFGMLPRRGQPAADGYSFGSDGSPINSNPVKSGFIDVQRAASLCQPGGGASQSWRETHLEIDGGRMDGFARLGASSMLYWDEPDLPFYYSLANTFALANRWFSSAPCQTYPNRRFLLAGTAFGLISTDTNSVTQAPPNGTIFDRLSGHGIGWRDYYTDVPATAVIFPIVQKYPANHLPIAQFYADCAAGTLPAVSFVDSDIGAASIVGGNVLGAVQTPFVNSVGDQVSTQNQDEEGPANLALGENFVSNVVNAVLHSPAWPRILLVWVYDEHGRCYDHVPPPAAIPPDSIPPKLGPNDPPGGYDIYGPRVPAVVVSGHARPHSVSNVVHDHTSILATIEAKWNLPAMTYRDANAATLADFLDARAPTFPDPPTLAAPHDLLDAEARCSLAEPHFAVHSSPRPGGATANGRNLVVRFYGRRHGVPGGAATLFTTQGTIDGVEIELLRGKHAVAIAHVAHVGPARHRVVLRPRTSQRLAAGRYTLLVRAGAATLVKRRVTIG
jgi:phospholipase C